MIDLHAHWIKDGGPDVVTFEDWVHDHTIQCDQCDNRDLEDNINVIRPNSFYPIRQCSDCQIKRPYICDDYAADMRGQEMREYA